MLSWKVYGKKALVVMLYIMACSYELGAFNIFMIGRDIFMIFNTFVCRTSVCRIEEEGRGVGEGGENGG